jgi:LPXTG-site transpeptidase (sortase) family protein
LEGIVVDNKPAFIRFGMTPVILLSIFLSLFGAPTPAYAAGLDVQPLTWNIIGLDSNKPATGPNHFPVGARVCNNSGVPISDVTATLKWDSANPYISFRPGTSDTVIRFASPDSLAGGACADFYFEVEVDKDIRAYDTTRRYHIAVTAVDTATGLTIFSGSTPSPRELYVEHLVSQSRNAVTDVQYGTDKTNLTSVPAGGTMALVVGQTYFIKLVGFTATQGYNQLESFINFPNTIFQVLSVESVYSAPSAGYAIDKMYSDACGWDNVVSSPTYRSCIASDNKTGGGIQVTYEVRIKKVPDGSTNPVTNPEPLSTLIYDFSGSSFHYNADFGISGRYAYVLDAKAIDISKSFSPATISPGNTSTLTFTLKNNTPVTVAGVSFTDTLPSLTEGATTGQMVADPATYSDSGCGMASGMSFASGDTLLSFSGGAIAPNGTCTISVSVSVPADPTSGNYHNESGTVKVGDLDSGHKAIADLAIDAAAISPGTRICGASMAYWDIGTVATASPPTPVLGSNVTIAAAQFFGAAGATSSVVIANPSNLVGPPASSGGGSWQSDGYPKSTAPVLGMDSSLEFRVDSSKYTDVTLQFDDYGSASFVNANYLYVWSSTDGSNWQLVSGGVDPILKTTWNRSAAFPAFDTGTNTTTYFRVSASGANNSSGTLQFDDVRITGCSDPVQPTLTKSFSPNPVVVGGTSRLTFTLSNDNTVNLTGVKFVDTLPAGLEVSATPNVATTCTNAAAPQPSWAPAASSTLLEFGQTTGGTIPAGNATNPGTCTASVDVIATTDGPHQNISDFIYTAEGGTNSDPSGSAKANLVAVLPPTIDKNFNPSTILANESSTLTFILTNPNPSDALSNVAFSDTLPPAMILASDVTTPQCGGTVTGTAGTAAVSFSNGSIPAGDSCTVAVEVTASSLGDYVNTSQPVTVTIGGESKGTDTAKATLTVNAPNPAISILKRVSTSATGPWYPFLTVAPGTPLYYQFAVENTGDVGLDNVSVSDPTLTGLGMDLSGCTWATLARYTDAVTCVTSSTPAQPGGNPNTATAQGTYALESETKTAYSSALYTGVNSGEFTLIKQISTKPTGPWSSSITAVDPGSTVYYKFTIINATGGPLTSINITDVDPGVDTANCTFTDPLPNASATTCIVSASASTTALSKHTNTATAHGTDSTSNVIDSPTSSADYTLKAPDLKVSKSNNTSGDGKVGTAFTWTISVENIGTDTATLADGQTVLSDPLPAGATYSNFADPALPGLFCALTTSPDEIICTASGGFSLNPGDGFDVTVDASPTEAGDLSNTATVDPDANVPENDKGNNASSDIVAVLVPPSIAKSFLDNPIAAGGTSTLRFTVTSPNLTTALTEVAFSDTLPTGMTLAADATTSQCDGTVTGVSGSGTVSLSGGSVAANSSCTVDVTVTVVAGGDYANTSDAISSINGGTGNSALDTLRVFELVKSIVATSESSTTIQGSYERVAVGEIIRYRLTTTLPEGTWNNFQIVDALDTGIQFLNGATVSFDCDEACSYETFTITPDPKADPYPYGSSTDPTFNFGTITNPDTDSDTEYLIVEFNALVLNMAGNNSSATAATRTNTYTVSIDGSVIDISNLVGVRVAEPSIANLTKTVSPVTGPYGLGDTITYTLKYSNTSSGVGRGTAFDIYLTDTLDATYLDLQSVTVIAPAGVNVTDTSTTGVGGEVRVYVDALPPVDDIPGVTKDVTVTVTAKIVGSPVGGQVISNTANLTYTSLPGGVTTGDSNGTCPNPTGSCTPGTSGSLTGERNGNGVAPNDNNDTATANITITVVNAPPVANDDSASTQLNTPVTFSATDNDTDSDGTVDPSTVDLDPSTAGQQTTYTDGDGNVWSVDASGNVTFAPTATFNGIATIPYTVQDNEGAASNQANLIVLVENNPPVATNNGGSVDGKNTTHSGNMVTDDEGYGVDSDPDSDPLIVTQLDGETNPANDVPGLYGGLDWAPDGSYTYTLDTSDPDYLLLPGGVTVTETFLYTISDGNGDTDTANIIISVTGTDDVPVANNDSFTTPEDTTLNGDLKPDHGSGADVPSGDGDNVWSIVSDPLHGTVTVNPDGTFTYTPYADYNGPDLFTYKICDVDGDCDQATVSLTISGVEDPSIGIAKRVANISRVGSGTFDVTLEFHVQNYGDVSLSNVQVADDLSVTFPSPTTFTVKSVTVSGLTNATLTANPGYTGNSDVNLLTTFGNSLAINGSATITVVVSVLPSSAGPFFNSAAAQGETPTGTTVTDDSSDGTDPDDTASCPTCVNGDDDPTNNTKQTEINFEANIFDPPFGFKELDASGLPVLRWTMIWINDNNFPTVAAVTDPIPAGSTYEATGVSSGFPVPGGAPAGSTNLGVSCTADSAAEPAPGDAESTTSLCYYEGPTATYPRGRIVWEGVLGPDLGATNQANANDEVYITFTVRVATGVTTVQNVASIDADLNNDTDLTDPGEQVVATAQAAWQEPFTPVDGREGKRLPATGFAPGKITALPEQKPGQTYADLGGLWLEIPRLGVKTPVVGVPKNAGAWNVDWLWDQTGWLQGTAFPTWVGSSVLTAHVYLPDGIPGPFVDLSKLRYGDKVIVHAFGERYIYEVRTNRVILPTDMSPFKHEEKAWLTLLTCKSYDESTDSYKYRVEARAVLIKVEAE